MANEIPAGLKVETIKPHEGPVIYATASQVLQTGNDFSLIFTRLQPAVAEGLQPGMGIAVAMPAGIIQLSPGSAKDLLIALQAEVAKFEAKFGKIDTDFSRSFVAAKK